MLRELDLDKKMDRQASKDLMDALGPVLGALQQEVRALKIPVVILFEGPRTAGKVTCLATLILNFDPRGFWVHSIRGSEGDEKRKPWIWRFAKKTPARGDIALFDHSWYFGMRLKQSEGGVADTDCICEINALERQLCDDGCLVLKYFLHISKDEQKKRLKKLASTKATRWQVTEQDIDNLNQYEKNVEQFEQMLQKTDTPWAKWTLIPATDKHYARAAVLTSVAEELKKAIRAKKEEQRLFISTGRQRSKFTRLPMAPIASLDLSASISEEEYKQEKKQLQSRLRVLHSMLYSSKIPMVIVFEGNDAAGKGGNIKRIAQALDPRGYAVLPTGAPTPDELAHHYLWRFLQGLPRTGHISIFDRSWYGRVLVERVEKLVREETMPRSYDEINEFEYMLKSWGAILLKFWVAVDKDEQLRRFEDRQNTPEKKWKITEEDWRNREKWDDYVQAIDDMFAHTNTDFAPWTVVESNCKRFARLKTLGAVITAIERRL